MLVPLGPVRRFDPAVVPMDARGIDAVVVLEEGADPESCGDLVLPEADPLPDQIGGRLDSAVCAYVDLALAEGPRREHGDGNESIVAASAHDHQCRERELGCFELGVPRHPPKELGDRHRLEVQVDAEWLHLAGCERVGAIEVVDPAEAEWQTHRLLPEFREHVLAEHLDRLHVELVIEPLDLDDHLVDAHLL